MPSAKANAARFIERAIFCAVLAVIIIAAIPYGTVEPWWESLFECAVFALGVLWVLEGAWRGTWDLQGQRLLFPLLALIAFALIQTISWRSTGATGSVKGLWTSVSADPYETWRFALKLLALTILLALLLHYTNSKRRLRILINVLIGICVASALFGLMRQTTQHEALGFFLPFLRKESGYGQFINKNHFALLMEMGFGLTLGLLAGGGVRSERALLYAALLMPIWTTIILSNSRGGIMGMLGQLLFTALLFTSVRPAKVSGNERMRRPEASKILLMAQRLMNTLVARVVLIVVLVMAVVVGILWIGGDPLVSSLADVRKEVGVEESAEQNGSSRREIWRDTWKMAKDNPVIGVGLGGYWTAITRYHDASGELTPQQAHNDYLELLASGGIVGALIGIWFAIGLIKAARERLRSPDPFSRAACFGALVGIFGAGLHSIVDFGLHITINAAVLMALIAIATVRIRDEDEDGEFSALPVTQRFERALES
ncbi:MAG: O-antigen ligase family protein [Pyrinomonadaceae bacterium]